MQLVFCEKKDRRSLYVIGMNILCKFDVADHWCCELCRYCLTTNEILKRNMSEKAVSLLSSRECVVRITNKH